MFWLQLWNRVVLWRMIIEKGQKNVDFTDYCSYFTSQFNEFKEGAMPPSPPWIRPWPKFLGENGSICEDLKVISWHQSSPRWRRGLLQRRVLTFLNLRVLRERYHHIKLFLLVSLAIKNKLKYANITFIWKTLMKYYIDCPRSLDEFLWYTPYIEIV